jgi:hypothetical protein
LNPKDKVTSFELNECIAFGDSMSDYHLFEEPEHTVSINSDSTLRDLARYHYEGWDLHAAFLHICGALVTERVVGPQSRGQHRSNQQ